ncbi:site-specific integrase [Conexibacter sp. SYSU D00693]|uniref:tyrosine-type recombinase/integrase n=1 Tax=Conexibacter sp. SYSU D00693 TaxID=2812560 RepID=UPI00196A456F|nr:site-specific integrase [Conexibacter sp. SYSU D00693]
MFRVDRKKGPVWYAKYRLPDGRQVKRKIGPAWTGRGRPANGYVTKRTAEAWLREVLDEARERWVPGSKAHEATFADAAAEWLRYCEQDRGCKPSTMRSYRGSLNGRLLPAFGAMKVGDITPLHIERWLAQLPVSPRSKNKMLIEMHGVFRRAQKVYGLRDNPAAQVERLRAPRRLDLQVLEPEEVQALVRAAACEQDAAIYLTAAYTGLRRGELLALRWRDVDFAGSTVRVRASFCAGVESTPKSGKVRAVPLAPDVAATLARLGQRERWTADDDLVFVGELGGYLDGSALRRRFNIALERAGLRRLRFHDLRHTFGTRMIAKADILRVKEWMGHADVQTTMRYLHYTPRPDDARLVAEAFAVTAPLSVERLAAS